METRYLFEKVLKNYVHKAIFTVIFAFNVHILSYQQVVFTVTKASKLPLMSRITSIFCIFCNMRPVNIKGRKISKSIRVKGQLISKCPFGVIVWTKIPTKKFPRFLP